LTALAIDLSIIAIVTFCAWRGYKNGLIRSVFGVVALIVSLIIANIAAEAYSGEITGVIKPFVSGIVDSTLTKMVEEEVEYEPVEHEDDTEEFAMTYTALRRLGLPKAAAIRIAELVAEEDIEGFISDLIADNLSSILAFVAVLGIAFLLMAIIFAVIGNLIGFVFSLPGLRLVDIIAGVAFGLVKAMIIVFTLAAVVRYFGLLAVSTLEETSILNYLVNNNPIAEALGI